MSARVFIAFFCGACMALLAAGSTYASDPDTTLAGPDVAGPGAVVVAPPVQMDFLSGYYQQDGDHSAVTGGEGTEALKDFSSIIKINIPLRKSRSLQLDTRMNYFTSASSDNIDPKTMTGASRNDFKINIQAAVTHELRAEKSADSDAMRPGRSITWELGASHEAHFASINAGLSMAGSGPYGMGDWSVSAGYVMDVWGQYYRLSKLYPSDYYGRDRLDQDKRHTLDLAVSYDRILHSRVTAGVSIGLIQQFGLLSTPYHRIYFSDSEAIDLERLPDHRLRMPVSGRLNWAASDWLFFRTSYRFYWDNFGLKAHSVYAEIPLKPSGQFTIYPFYRYHTQRGHDYFAPKGAHSVAETYYTSDYDQSDLHSHYTGGGFRWTPFLPGREKKRRNVLFRSVEVRAGYYNRSDGFRSWLVSGGLSWAIIRDKEWED